MYIEGTKILINMGIFDYQRSLDKAGKNGSTVSQNMLEKNIS